MSALGSSRSRLPWLFAALSALAACRAERPALERPPDTRVAPVVDTIHGESFTDPYRWLEDQAAPDTRSWLDAQAAYAERILPRDELRRSLEQRLTELMDRADIGAPRRGGDAEFFTLRRPGEEIAAIYRRPAPEPGKRMPITAGGSYDLIVDPHPLSVAGTTRVELMTVDRKGRYLVYAVRDGGQDEVALRIRDLASGEDLPEVFPPGLYSSVVLTADDSGFYYSLRSRQTGARVRRHAWRSDVAADAELFGEGYGPTVVRHGAGVGRRPLAGVPGAARLGVHRRLRARPARPRRPAVPGGHRRSGAASIRASSRTRCGCAPISTPPTTASSPSISPGRRGSTGGWCCPSSRTCSRTSP